MLATFRKLAAAALLIGLGISNAAATVTFTATGVAGVSGTVSFDDTLFDGSSNQFLGNAAGITNLNLTVFGQVFTFATVDTGASTIIDSTGVDPRIVNGAGNLANNGVMAIAFFPDGFGGTATDGDASLSTGAANAGLADENFYAVQWVIADVNQVPEPASLMLIGLGLAGLGMSRRKRA